MTQDLFSRKATEHRDEAQLERLFDLLPSDLYDTVKGLPYASRYVIEKWHEQEASRLAPYMSRVVGGVQYSTPAVMSLLDSATSDRLDLQHVGAWLTNHRDEISAQFLVELVSAAMGRGVVNMMSQRGKTNRKNTTTRLQKLGRRWLQLKSEGRNKSQAGEVIAKELNMAYGTVYNHLTGDLEADKRIFPDGVNAAMKGLGLPV